MAGEAMEKFDLPCVNPELPLTLEEVKAHLLEKYPFLATEQGFLARMVGPGYN